MINNEFAVFAFPLFRLFLLISALICLLCCHCFCHIVLFFLHLMHRVSYCIDCCSCVVYYIIHPIPSTNSEDSSDREVFYSPIWTTTHIYCNAKLWEGVSIKHNSNDERRERQIDAMVKHTTEIWWRVNTVYVSLTIDCYYLDFILIDNSMKRDKLPNNKTIKEQKKNNST